MTNNSSDQNPVERYHTRMMELAENDPQINAMTLRAEVREALQQPDLTLAEVIAILLDAYGERPALGERSYEIKPDNTGLQLRHYLSEYTTISYKQLRERVEALASAWLNHEHHRVNIGDNICILGFTGIDFGVIEIASNYTQAVTVPLQSSLAGAELDRILEATHPTCLVTTINDVELAAKLAIDNGAIHNVIVIEYDPRVSTEQAAFESAKELIEHAGADIQLDTIDTLIEFGKNYSWQPLPRHPDGLERSACIMHSSGSTGTPKGIIVPERMAKHGWTGGVEQVQVPIVGIAFGPMNHFLGRYQVFGPLSVGGTCYYTEKPDLSTLFDDIRIIRPTFISFFPRVFELIYQYYQSEVVRRVGEGLGDNEAMDAQVRAEMHDSFLGDRLRCGSIGSAPTAPEVINFIRECFDICLFEGYGSSEGGIIITFNGFIARPPIIDYKLRDVPELGYYTTDKPYPRGELCVKSELQFGGYFNRPEATAAVMDDDGFVMTGDIMEERGPDHIIYIDRSNDVLKLSNAEFVAVGPLGATYEGGSAVIKQIYIYGNSSRAYLLAVVVPDMDVVASIVGHTPDETEIKALVRSELQEVAAMNTLRTFEVPRDFLIEYEAFSHENGLLSSVRKRMRPRFKAKYSERLEALYEQIERKRHEELMALKDPNSPLTILEKVVKALEASLGIEGIDSATELNFSQLGGDSLGSVSFSMFIEDIFGVALPVNAIVSPAGHPQRWAQAIESALGNNGQLVSSFDSIHGKDADILYAKDLNIMHFLHEETLAQVSTEEPPVETRTVLLTGANGFLGRFLCLMWLEELAKSNGTLICLIRAVSDEAAKKRLDAVFEGLDPELEQHYHALAEKHLEVIASDIAEPNLGLSQDGWDNLAERVERIVHPAALVNHRLSYKHLFGPNVFGVAELIRLALSKQQKRFDFVSSAAVTLLVDTTNGNNEDSPLLANIPVAEHYAAGYGASKWADEVLLKSAHQQFGLPVNIYRGDMIMPHSDYKGQINKTDMITRLLYSLVMTGLAPKSFYQLESDGSRPRAHYDGLPVDFIADFIIGSSKLTHRDIRTFNVANHHEDDGVSLDSFVDWVESAGFPIERIENHNEWVERFKAKLATFTEAQRQHSSLEIMGFIDKPHPAHEPLAESERFQKAVSQLSIGPKVPHLTEQYIHKYLEDMCKVGLIEKSDLLAS